MKKLVQLLCCSTLAAGALFVATGAQASPLKVAHEGCRSTSDYCITVIPGSSAIKQAHFKGRAVVDKKQYQSNLDWQFWRDGVFRVKVEAAKSHLNRIALEVSSVNGVPIANCRIMENGHPGVDPGIHQIFLTKGANGYRCSVH